MASPGRRGSVVPPNNMPRQHLTPNACLVCRRKRTKCDGQLPCRRCKSRSEECVYEDKKWRTKDHLRSEIERLRAEQRQDHALLRALTSNDPARWEKVLSRVRAGDSPETIAEWVFKHSGPSRGLADGRPEANGGSRVGIDSAPGQPMAPFDGTPKGRRAAGSPPLPSSSFQHYPDPRHSFPPPGLCSIAQNLARYEHPSPPESVVGPITHTWTNVTSDTGLVQQLLARFFANPLSYLSLVSQPHFMRDFGDGNPRYCSEALVNAILGLACRMATMPSRLISRVSFGEAFIGEAKRLLAGEPDHVNLPSIQALGVVALAEVARGNEEEATDLARESVRACIRILLQSQQQQDHGFDEDFRTVLASAYCGGFSLNRFIRLLTGSLEPKAGPLFMRLYPDSEDVGDDAPEARLERGIALHVHFFTQLPYCPPLARFIFDVTEAVHTFSTYNYSKAMTADDLDEAFDKCTRCHRQVADLFMHDRDAGPDVLLAQIWYNFCLLSLLQSFARDSASLEDGLPRSLSVGETPHTVCRQASEAIICLVSTYQTRYSLSNLPPLLPHMVFSAVLYQLSLLVAPEPCHTQQHYHQHRVASPEPMFPGQPMHDTPYSASGAAGSSIFRAVNPFAATTACKPEPSSPLWAMQSPKSGDRRNSALSMSSTCFSTDEQARRSSIGSIVSSATSEGNHQGGPETDDSDTGTVPASSFASESHPGELVAIGFLQLVSMGARHPGAASAASLLRTVGSVRGTARPAFYLSPMAEAGPISAWCTANSGVRLSLGGHGSLTVGPSHIANCEVDPLMQPHAAGQALSQSLDAPAGMPDQVPHQKSSSIIRGLCRVEI